MATNAPLTLAARSSVASTLPLTAMTSTHAPTTIATNSRVAITFPFRAAEDAKIQTIAMITTFAPKTTAILKLALALTLPLIAMISMNVPLTNAMAKEDAITFPSLTAHTGLAPTLLAMTTTNAPRTHAHQTDAFTVPSTATTMTSAPRMDVNP